MNRNLISYINIYSKHVSHIIRQKTLLCKRKKVELFCYIYLFLLFFLFYFSVPSDKSTYQKII